jgi:hypothetical protein
MACTMSNDETAFWIEWYFRFNHKIMIWESRHVVSWSRLTRKPIVYKSWVKVLVVQVEDASSQYTLPVVNCIVDWLLL